MFDSVFETNDALSRGGAIFGSSASVDLVRVSLCDNQAADSGGGAYLENGPEMLVRNATFLRNLAVDSGGALRIGGAGTVRQSTFVQNSAGSDGAALGARTAASTVYGSVFSEQQTATAVDVSPTCSTWQSTSSRSAAWDNGAGDYGPTVILTNAVDVVDDPFPTLPVDCGPPIPVFQGELVDRGDLLDLDGTPSDIGATGGPDADPALWASDGDPVPAMWDCAPEDPLAFPGNTEIPGDGIDNDCVDGNPVLETTDTGTVDGPDDTGPDAPDDTAGGEPPADGPPRDVASAPPGGTGCGCGSAPGVGWAAIGLVLRLRRQSR